MQRVKRAIALLAAVVFMATIFAGCKSQTKENDSQASVQKGTTTESTANSNTTTSETPAVEVKLPDLKVKEPKVKYLCWTDKKELENPDSWIYPVNEILKEKYNTEISIVRTTYEELPSKAASMVMSGDSPDLIFYKNQDYPNFMLKDIVQPVDPYVDFNDPLWKDLKAVNDEYIWGGKHYLLIYSKFADDYVYYNKKLFEQAGLETPREYYKKGQWNWNTLLELAQQLTQDGDGDGNPDVWGFSVHPLYFMQSTGHNLVTYNADGTISNNLKDASLARAMNFIYETGPAKYNVRTTNLAAWHELFPQGKLAMLQDQQWVKWEIQKMLKDGEASFVPAPKDPESQDYYIGGRIGTEWIAKGAKNPEGAAAFMSIIRYRSLDPEIKDENKAKDIERFGHTDEDFALIEEMNNNFKLLIRNFEGMGNFGNDGQFKMWGAVGEWNTPWPTVVETYFPEFQAEIDKVSAEYKKVIDK